MYYPEELVEEVRARNDIVDVISGYVSLKKKGSNYWGCCPFHNEKTPSFSVSSNKQSRISIHWLGALTTSFIRPIRAILASMKSSSPKPP